MRSGDAAHGDAPAAGHLFRPREEVDEVVDAERAVAVRDARHLTFHFFSKLRARLIISKALPMLHVVGVDLIAEVLAVNFEHWAGLWRLDHELHH